MYSFDFISVVTGYILGVFLCWTTVQTIYLQDKDEDWTYVYCMDVHVRSRLRCNLSYKLDVNPCQI